MQVILGIAMTMPKCKIECNKNYSNPKTYINIYTNAPQFWIKLSKETQLYRLKEDKSILDKPGGQ